MNKNNPENILTDTQKLCFTCNTFGEKCYPSSPRCPVVIALGSESRVEYTPIQHTCGIPEPEDRRRNWPGY